MDQKDILARLHEIRPQIEPIQGWLDPNAGGVLYQFAAFNAPNGNMVELGSWKGRSTAWLAWGVKDRGTGSVVAVDTWAGTQTATETLHARLLEGYGPDQLYEEFLGNLRRLGLEIGLAPMQRQLAAGSDVWLLSMGGPLANRALACEERGRFPLATRERRESSRPRGQGPGW